MYVRPPNNTPSELKLPENYSGNAFTRFSPYGDMPPPARAPILKGDAPSMRDLPYEPEPEPEPKIEREPRDVSSDPHPTFKQDAREEKKGSLLSSLLPDFDLSKHFPFGHGIGGEELLILAVMLIVFVSGNDRGEVDSELLLLLGLLLFAG